MVPKPAARAKHPALFAILYMPFGITTGFVQVTLAFLATKSGLTVQQGAELIAIQLFPQFWKFLWAPLADTTLTRRTWYLLSNVACAASLFLCTALPLSLHDFTLMRVLILVMSVASTFLGFAAEGLLAYLTPPEQRGRYSGWYQAGNLGGTGLGGGFGLWLLLHVSHLVAAVGMAGFVLACLPAVFAMPDVLAESTDLPFVRAIANAGIDLWESFRTRAGILSAVILFLPVGTGTAVFVLAQAEVAQFWKVDAGVVGTCQGALGGVVAMIGCLIGGYGCNRLGSRAAYAIYGALMALTTAAMAAAAFTPFTYVAGVMVYTLINGFCYAAFSGVVLDAIGKGNAATKYNVYASLSNFPIWYMGLVLAWAQTKWGPRQMLLTESACGVAGILVFLAAAALPFGRHWGAEKSIVRSGGV